MSNYFKVHDDKSVDSLVEFAVVSKSQNRLVAKYTNPDTAIMAYELHNGGAEFDALYGDFDIRGLTKEMADNKEFVANDGYSIFDDSGVVIAETQEDALYIYDNLAKNEPEHIYSVKANGMVVELTSFSIVDDYDNFVENTYSSYQEAFVACDELMYISDHELSDNTFDVVGIGEGLDEWVSIEMDESIVFGRSPEEALSVYMSNDYVDVAHADDIENMMQILDQYESLDDFEASQELQERHVDYSKRGSSLQAAHTVEKIYEHEQLIDLGVVDSEQPIAVSEQVVDVESMESVVSNDDFDFDL